MIVFNNESEDTVTPKEFEDSFKKDARLGWEWSVSHWTTTVPVACFVIGFIFGKFI